MKLNPKTISLLKNFSTINPSIVLKPGNILSTISPTKSIMARATVTDNFDKEVPIYNLSRFISSYSLMEDADIEFGDNSLTMSDPTTSMVYHYSEASLIMVPPDREIKIPSVDVQCRLTNKDIQSVTKALGVLGLPDIAFVGDGEKILLQTVDNKNTSSDTYSVEVGKSDKVFRAIFRPENIRMIDGDYEVEISSKGISKFTGTEATYWIAVEQTSQF